MKTQKQISSNTKVSEKIVKVPHIGPRPRAAKTVKTQDARTTKKQSKCK